MPPKTRTHLSDTAIPTGYASSPVATDSVSGIGSVGSSFSSGLSGASSGVSSSTNSMSSSSASSLSSSTNAFQTVPVGSGQSLYSSEAQPSVTTSNLPSKPQKAKYNNSWARWIAASTVIILVLVGIVAGVIAQTKKNQLAQQAASQQTVSEDYSAMSIPLKELAETGQLTIDPDSQLVINGQLKVMNGFILNPTTQPTNSVAGQFYVDNQTNQAYYYNGTSYQQIATTNNTVTSIQGQSGPLTLGPGLYLNGSTIGITNPFTPTPTTPTGVTSLQGQTGAVSLIPGTAISISGTTITNTGVISVGSASGAINVGSGLAVTGNTLSSTVSLSSLSSTLTIGNDGNGNFTITQTGSGTSGTVALGPAAPQVDTSTTPSISVNKTGNGELMHFAYSGTDQFVVDQNGNITLGTISYSQITGTPAVVNSIVPLPI